MSDSDRAKGKDPDLKKQKEKKKKKDKPSKGQPPETENFQPVSDSTTKKKKKNRNAKHSPGAESSLSKNGNSDIFDLKDLSINSQEATSSDFNESSKNVTSEPQKWKDVEDEEMRKLQIDFLDSNVELQSNDDKYFCDGEDLLGLNSGGDIVDPKMDPTCNEFDPYYYLKTIHIDTSWDDLLLGMHNLESKITSRQNKLESLVKNSFSRFVACKDSIDSIFLQIDAEKQSSFQLIQQLKITLYGIMETSKSVFGGVLSNQSQADVIRSGLNILKKSQFIFNLPDRMRSDIEKNEYYKVVLNYNKAKSFTMTSSNTLFKNVISEVEVIVKNLCKKLFEQLELQETNFLQQELLIEYLIQLDAEEDPAWKCINLRFNRMNQLLEKKKSMTEDDVHNYGGGASTNSKQDSLTLHVIEVLMENLPFLWEMTHKYLDGVYHKNYYYSNEKKIRAIGNNYSIHEAEAISLINQIQVNASKLIVKDDCYKFYKNAGFCVRPLAKQYINYIFELDLHGDEDFEAFINENFMKQSMGFKKEKILALIKLVQYLKTTIPMSNLRVLMGLLEFKNSLYISESLNNMLNTLEEWYLNEDWRIINYRHMITSLPQKFETSLIKLILDYSDFVLPDDPLLVYIYRMLADFVLRFYDILYRLAFESKDATSAIGSAEESQKIINEKIDMNNPSSKLILLYNQCTYVKEVMLPKVENLLSTIFQRNFSVKCEAKELNLISDLQCMILKKYLMEKAQILNRVIKEELVVDVDPITTVNSQKELVRDHIKISLLKLVHIYDEVTKFCPKLLRHIVVTLVESAYQCLLDKFNLIRPNSVREIQQIKTELDFFSETIKNYKSETSNRLHVQVLKGLRHLESHKFGRSSPEDAAYISELNCHSAKLSNDMRTVFRCFSE